MLGNQPQSICESLKRNPHDIESIVAGWRQAGMLNGLSSAATGAGAEPARDGIVQ